MTVRAHKNQPLQRSPIFSAKNKTTASYRAGIANVKSDIGGEVEVRD
jgi:hypothetical protein